MSESKADRNERFFEEYRQKRLHLQNLNDQHRQAEQLVNDIRNEISKTNDEIHQMRRVITSVIENDVDPTQAKLAGVDESMDSLWQNGMFSHIKIGGLTTTLDHGMAGSVLLTSMGYNAGHHDSNSIKI